MTYGDVVFRKYKDDPERIAAAIAANAEGSLPQTTDDILHTMELLLANGLSAADVAKTVGVALNIPTQVAQTYVKKVRERVKKRNLRAAITSVIQGRVTIGDAAREHKVSATDLQKALSDNSESSQSKFNDEMLKMQNTVIGASRRIGALMTYILQLLNSGELSGDEAVALAKSNQRLIQAMMKNADQWVARLEQSTGVVKATAKGFTRKRRADTASVPAASTPGKPNAALSALKLMGLDPDTPASKKLSPEQFTLQAIEKLAEVPTKRNLPHRGRVIHTVYSKFNDAFRLYFNQDPVEAVRMLALNRKIGTKLARGGAVIAKPGVLIDAPPREELAAPPKLNRSVSRLDQHRLGGK